MAPERPRGPQDGSRWPRDGPKRAARRPQERPKMAKDGPKRVLINAYDRSVALRSRHKDCRRYLGHSRGEARSRPGLQDGFEMAPKRSPEGPKISKKAAQAQAWNKKHIEI